METLARIEFVSLLVEQNVLSREDGILIINRTRTHPGKFLKDLAECGLVVTSNEELQ